MAVVLGRKGGGAGGGGAPSGAAGGDLGGTYPNPTLSAAKQAELDAKVPKSLYDANTVLAANSDDTPAALTMGASTVLARLAAGNIKAASVAEMQALLGIPVELAYAEVTAPVTVSGTNYAGSNTVVSAGSVAYAAGDIWVEFFAPYADPGATAGSSITIGITVDGSDAGSSWNCAKDNSAVASKGYAGVFFRTEITVTAANHTILIHAYRGVANGTIGAGAGGAGAFSPAYIRIMSA